MGMFDYVKVEYPIAGWKPYPEEGAALRNDANEDLFQTKDFDRLMNLYIITKEGNLLRDESTRHTSCEPYHYRYTGKMRFHTIDTHGNFVECRATFKHGVVGTIKRMYAMDHLEDEINEIKKKLNKEKRSNGTTKVASNRKERGSNRKRNSRKAR